MNFNTKLWIEGKPVDLTDRFDGSVNYSLDNIKDISTISSNYSTTITLPGTNQNCQLFNWLFNPKFVGSGISGSANIGSNYDFKRKAKAVLIQDGQIILDGYAKLVSATVNNNLASFEIQISSPISSLISNLGDTRLEDLYPASGSTPYDHPLTLASITGSWNMSASDDAIGAGIPYLYPLHDSGQFETVNGSSFYIQNLRPAVYLKAMLDLCVATASFTYESDFLNSDYFQSIVMPYKDGDLNFPKANYTDANLGVLNTVVSQSAVSRSIDDNTVQLFEDITQGALFTTGSFYPIQSSVYAFTTAFNFQVFYSTTTDFINKTTTPIYGLISVAAYKKSDDSLARPKVFTKFAFDAHLTFSALNATSSLQNISITNNLLVNQDEYAKVYLCWSTKGNIYQFGTDGHHEGTINGIAEVFTFFDANAVLSIDSSNVIDGNIITYQMLIGKDIKCTDLVQSVLRTWNLYPVPDPSGRPQHLIIKTHDQFYSNTNTLDWTSKLNKAEDFKVTPIPQIDTGFLLFALKDDKDYWNTIYSNQYSGRYGQLRANLEYDFSQDTKDVLDGVIFSPTVPVQYSSQLFPCEQFCETTGSLINVFGYSASLPSATTSSLSSNPFKLARKGGQISYFGNTYSIINVVNPQSFQVDRPLVPTSNQATFQYITNQSSTVLPIYQSKDGNLTRSTLAVNPRILFYNGLRPVQNPVYIQYTPQLTNISYSYYTGTQSSSYWVSPSMVPHVSHINDDLLPDKDLLFAEPGQVFFSISQYPTSCLFDFWENSVNEIADSEAKLITAKIHLNSIDISNLDFSNRIYIDGTNYRLSAINGYTSNPNETTEIELVRQPFQVYFPTGSNIIPPVVPTSSMNLPIQVSASVSSLSTGSAIIGVSVSGSAVSYISGNNFVLTAGQKGLFTGSIAAQGINNVRVFVSGSSVGSSSLYVIDFATTSSYQITGSGFIDTSKVLLTGSVLYVTIQPFVPNTTLINGTAGTFYETGIVSYSPVWSFPGTTVQGYHSAFTGAINCNILAAAGVASNIRLIVNGSTVQTLTCTSFFTGDRTFTSRTFSTSDQITVDWETNI